MHEMIFFEYKEIPSFFKFGSKNENENKSKSSLKNWSLFSIRYFFSPSIGKYFSFYCFPLKLHICNKINI